MARQPTPDGRRVHMNVKFSEAEAAAIDEARGETKRGTWVRETVLRDLPRVVVVLPAPPPAAGKRPRAKAAAPPPDPRVSAGTATAVFQPAGAEPVVTAPVPAKTPVVAPSLRRASDLPVPPRCQHEGIRRIGGWCSKCMADVKPGGKLPKDWVMPEGWSPS